MQSQQQQPPQSNGNGTNSHESSISPEPQQQQPPPASQLIDIEIDEESPLSRFPKAKKHIFNIFSELDSYVANAKEYYENCDILDESSTDRLRDMNATIGAIKNVISRNRMKVAFFGRTSNGKSTAINAILGDEVLPTSSGDTTSCFLQIHGNKGNEAFLVVQRKDDDEDDIEGGDYDDQNGDKIPIEKLNSLTNAQNKKTCLNCSSKVKIHWPISKCQLLRHDIILVDSPGVDFDSDMDKYIDKYCLDADVFVYVSDAMVGVPNIKNNFFHKVSEKLSKPNIFVLNNKWDLQRQDQAGIAREYQLDRISRFLCEELKIYSEQEATNKTFFVSAQEMLIERCPHGETGRYYAQQGGINKLGSEERRKEFERFELAFEKSLSESAVKTKFEKHVVKGKETVRELKEILDKLLACVEETGHKKGTERVNLEQNLEAIRKSFPSLIDDDSFAPDKVVGKIRQTLQESAEAAFKKEIGQLKYIANDFDLVFPTNSSDLAHYKKELYEHVEKELSDRIQSTFNRLVKTIVFPFYEDIVDLIRERLPANRQEAIIQAIRMSSKTKNFDLKIYRQYYTNFKEDLRFKFSLNPYYLLRKLQSLFASVDEQHTEQQQQQDLSETQEVAVVPSAAMLSLLLLNTPKETTVVGSIAFGGVLVSYLGFKPVIAIATIYGSLYAYERLTWNNAKKEKTFKAQYVKYAKRGLELSALTVSHQLEQEIGDKLEDVFGTVKTEVKSEISELDTRIGSLKKSLEKLSDCKAFTIRLLSKNNHLLEELAEFAGSYLLVQ